MKKKILIAAAGSDAWIGGLYYKRNILYSLTLNDRITEEYEFVAVTSPENRWLFEHISDKVRIAEIEDSNSFLFHIKLIDACIRYHCKFLFSVSGKVFAPFLNLIGVTPIYWIADFQHDLYPEYFHKDEVKYKTAKYQSITDMNYPLVLSSYDCLHLYRQFYSKTRKKVYVVPFVSYIENELNEMDSRYEKRVLNKFGLTGIQYVCISNQFWKHKNHIVVAEAIKEFALRYSDKKICFVFTGKLLEYRDENYIKKIKSLLNEQEAAGRIKLTGFIDRKEQLVLMKNAEFVIQPSLSEGWGTVLEDCRVLDKTVLLSDIPIHREQMYDKCILFHPHDARLLADLIYLETLKEHNDFMERGLENMRKRAGEYSKGFERLIFEADHTGRKRN